VNCPRCAAENGPLARFCQACGLALGRSCGACGAALDDKALFCPQCGTAVATPPAARPAARAQPNAPAAGERRQATVLFADIAGYTELCARLDAEAVQALLDPFYAAMDGAVLGHGGTVIDHAGDGVFAVFGAPIAHDNDVERAVRSALAMHAAAAQIDDPSTGRALFVHIGIASGEVVAATLEGGATPKYSVTGDTVNLAARVAALAAAGETLVGESVRRALAARVDVDDLGPRPLKGYARPVPVFRVRGLRSSAVERLAFVGRRAELRQLEGALDGLRGGAGGAALLIRGEAGIGKSRLVEELVQRANARGCACHQGRVLDFGIGTHDDALAAVLTSLLGLPASAGLDARREALTGAVDEARIEDRHEPSLADLLGVEQRPALRALYDAMDHATRLGRSADAAAALASAAVRVRPAVVVLEDIHWASPLILACLAALAMATRRVPLLLAMTTRFEGDPIDRAWRAASHGTPLLTLDVGPLDPEEARVLAGGMLESSERFAQQCIERAEGNPLFLEQLLRNALEAEGAGVPPTIQSLVLARMDRLPARDKVALQAASVIGKRFALEGLRVLLDDAGYRCDTLLATDLVRPEGGDYAFAHALIQEGAYASLLHARRRELHARAASWYAGREPSLVAEHLDRAQRTVDAAAAYLEAARAQAGRRRDDEALRLAERGAALVPDGATGTALTRLRGDLLRELGRTDESLRAFEHALAMAVGDADRCAAWLGIVHALRVTGEVPRALETLDRAQPVAEALADAATLSRIHNLRGNLYFAIGRIDECGREHTLALQHARATGDREAESLALSGVGDHAYAQGRMLTALVHFRQCVALSRELGLVRADIVNSCMVGHCHSWSGNGDAGVAEIRAAVDLAARLGLPQTRVMALESLAMMLTLRGDIDAAEPIIEEALEAARRASARRYLTIDLMLKANCRLLRHRPAEARALLEEGIDLARQTGLGFIGPALYAAMALVCDDAAERRRWLADGEALLGGESLVHGRLMFYRHAMDAALVDGRLDEALRLADAAEASERGEPLVLARLGAARARLLVRLQLEGAAPGLVAELRALAAHARRVGMGALAYGIDDALAATRAPA
jgi:class 3 adenylate cyclase/tetratricopeptide (TPR) repeat protein